MKITGMIRQANYLNDAQKKNHFNESSYRQGMD